MKRFLTGIGMGTAIGLLLAPETGSQTRKKLVTRAAKLAIRLEKKFDGRSVKPADHAHVQMEAKESGVSPDVSLSPDSHETLSTLDPVAEVLNTASKTQLRKVPGIGDARARRIIENRPFESEAEVVESKVIPETVLKKLKDKLVDTDEGVA
jgi:DNA uptake protein ComE-like DNA-binding protein